MRRDAARTRWALGFADLCLLLLAFLVLLHVRQGDRAAVARSLRAAFGRSADASVAGFPAASLFQPGEAVLRPEARARLLMLARGAAGARVESAGRDGGGGRFDGWELAAARTAAVARAVAAGGLAAERIAVAMPPIAGAATGQRITVTVVRP